jgi:hypothetical protein
MSGSKPSPRPRRAPRTAAVLVAALLAGACHSAGQYGYAKSYDPLSEEEDAAEGAREFDPVMMEREPESWRGTKLSIFGIVKGRTQAPGGAAYLTLSVRRLLDRNLCDSMDEDTCRVSVTDHEFGLFHAIVKLTPEDDIGKLSLSTGSLVRVIGTLTDDADKNDGMQVLKGVYYRHWPRNYFVTDADRDHMKM